MNETSVLFIEDDPLLASTLSERLSQNGITVTHAKTVAEAVAHTASAFSAIITDITLPDGNGLTTALTLRTGEDVPIVALTNNDIDSVVPTGESLPNVTYILKAGHSMADIVAAIEVVIQK